MNLKVRRTPENFAARRDGGAAEYIALEASRLARIANAREFPLLAYLIDMVVLEAWREANEAESAASDDAFMGADGA